jgi:asparagine synthase (glutamine-hydrolysing)
MCGIAGFLNWDGFQSGASSDLKRMTDAISRRGPDDCGEWIDERAGIALGHRRLAVVDLSPAGHQPMMSQSERYAIILNGEIYNHRDLRADVDKDNCSVNWRGHSDTEVLLESFDRFGIVETLRKAVGMFAFVLWDKRDRVLTMARDRMGEKPLYFGWQGRYLLFGSELGALRAHPSFQADVDRNALTLLMRHSYIPAPYSIYQGINKLQPGQVLSLKIGEREPNTFTYWDAATTSENAKANPFRGSPEEAVVELENRLRDALAGQMMADVPLGAFLSGGVDSSLIVALLQTMSDIPIQTFSIGFDVPGYNEAKYAKSVAQHLGTNHSELYVTGQNALDVVPMLPSLYTEPFSDSSQIPTYLVASMARRDVTVCLSGDGGDELFSGYNRYGLTDSTWAQLSNIPQPLRKMTASALRSISVNGWDSLLAPVLAIGPGRFRHQRVGEKLHKVAAVVDSKSPMEIYHRLISHWGEPTSVVIGGSEPATHMNGLSRVPKFDEFMHEMMYLDAISYLPDDILVKVDRAAMAVALEGRVPMLDHRVVEFAWSLPTSILRRGGVTKWPLRSILYKYVPKALIERPKMGFGVPIDEWLRGPLKDWAENLLDENRLQNEGYLNPKPITEKWREHKSGRRNWQHVLWNVLSFQAWLESTRS